MKKHIMVVDDDSGLLLLVNAMLTRHGFGVVKVAAADVALSLIEALTPDLFILDVMMPGMDGIELCQRLRDHALVDRTPVIILSMWDSPQRVATGLEAGADAYLSKTTMGYKLVPEVFRLLGTAGTRVG